MACAVPEVGRPAGWSCASIVAETVPGKRSVGLLLYRRRPDACEVFLIHPGGPFWRAKDSGAWSIPKGEPSSDEDLLDAARREFAEETGFRISGDFLPLAPIKQRGGKIIGAWAVEGDCDPTEIRSNTFTTEWPPHSGHVRAFPEVDRAAWFTIDDARGRITEGQRGFLDQLSQLLSRSSDQKTRR
ncbi:MAG: NUDIX domain-containing protein [Chloroflexi bacterium]|nr:MAG: NUDIX domain-containing protein [Chloroflexota bacterium]